MNKLTNFLIAAVGVFSIVVLTGPINAHAQQVNTLQKTDTVAIVSSINGLNLRGTNCEVLKTFSEQTLLDIPQPVKDYGPGYYSFGMHPEFEGQPLTKNCTVNGKSYQMIMVSYGSPFESKSVGYVAKDFLTFPYGKTGEQVDKGINNAKRVVDADGGLNLRDMQCHKVGAVPNGYVFEQPEFGVDGVIPPVCKVNGSYYAMDFVYANGQWVFAASSYVVFK